MSTVYINPLAHLAARGSGHERMVDPTFDTEEEALADMERCCRLIKARHRLATVHKTIRYCCPDCGHRSRTASEIKRHFKTCRKRPVGLPADERKYSTEVWWSHNLGNERFPTEAAARTAMLKIIHEDKQTMNEAKLQSFETEDPS